MPKVGPDVVPSFMLYGEAPHRDLPDLIHIEALKDRSQHHDWEIKPHRHVDLMQIMQFQTLDVHIHLDGTTIRTHRPTILIIPPMIIHGFHFSPDVTGTVATIPVELIADQKEGAPSLAQQAETMTAENSLFAHFTHILDQIEDEYVSQRPVREHALLYLIRLLGIWIERFTRACHGERAPETYLSQAESRVRSFLALIEQHYLDGWGTSEYGLAIGISKSQLTRDCRAVLNRSPLQLVHDRIIREANRKLAYTIWPIAEISDQLGFADLGYFSRFYRQKTGETPTDYRSRIRSHENAKVPSDLTSP